MFLMLSSPYVTARDSMLPVRFDSHGIALKLALVTFYAISYFELLKRNQQKLDSWTEPFVPFGAVHSNGNPIENAP